MKETIEEYGNTIVLVIVSVLCLIMFCTIFGSDSYMAKLAPTIFNLSMHDSTSKSTSGESYIVKSDGTKIYDSQNQIAKDSEAIQGRLAPTMQGSGIQNDTQAIINRDYKTSDLMCGLSDNGSGDLTTKITTSINKDNASYTKNNYFRVLSVTTNNGDYIIYNVGDNNKGIAYNAKGVKKGIAGAASQCINNVFDIKTQNGEDWFTYDIDTQTWNFKKAGTYCFRCFVVDAYGKSSTSTAYVAISQKKTDN